MTSNLVVAGSSPAGGAGQGNIGVEHGHYVSPYAEDGHLVEPVAAQENSVTAAQILAVATAWEQCADEARDDAARLGMDPDSAMMAIYAAEERMLRRHAAALRSLLSPASGTVAS